MSHFTKVREELWGGLSDEDFSNLIYSATSFPFGSAEAVIEALTAARQLHEDASTAAFMAMANAEAELDAEFAKYQAEQGRTNVP